MAYEERRKEDARKEQIVHELMERIFYSKFPTYRSNTDEDTQIKGVDCTFTSKGGIQWIVDEKAATKKDYINAGMMYPGEKNKRRHLGTFCLELSMRYKSGFNWKRYTGWFLNKNELNNAYLMIWVDNTKSGDIKNVDDITKMEFCFVKKEKLWGYINSLGWTREELEQQLNLILVNPSKYDGKTIRGLRFSHPYWLRNEESPVTILIPREVYIGLAEYHKIYVADNNTKEVAE